MNDSTKLAAPFQGVSGYKPMQPNPVKQRAVRIMNGTATFDERYLPDHTDLVAIVSELRDMGCKIAFTTGVWDLFHVGHGEYILAGKMETQKKYPDANIIMVVGLDTDALTKARKGPKRPIVPEDERARVLGHLRTVDIITPQYESNQLYKLIEHDVRIISTSTQDLPADHADIQAQCEHLINLPPQSETSTTARIRTLATDGGLEVLERVSDKLLKAIGEARDELGG
jgi:bifunctional ADP-heptose synthase (sugar kinase/adenylyltransferase)